LWGTVAGILMQVWIWGSLVVLLVNQRRRAVHDFLAPWWSMLGLRRAKGLYHLRNLPPPWQ
jgi:hypothetical protein